MLHLFLGGGGGASEKQVLLTFDFSANPREKAANKLNTRPTNLSDLIVFFFVRSGSPRSRSTDFFVTLRVYGLKRQSDEGAGECQSTIIHQ